MTVRIRRALFVWAFVLASTSAGLLGLGAVPAAQASDVALNTTLGLNHPIVGTDIGGLGGQYHQNNQRNFWWNARAQRWDGILPTASPPAAGRSHWWMWHDLGGTPTPIGLVENSTGRSPDAYWDEAAQTLYVFLSRGSSGTSKFRRFIYDASRDRYIEVSASGGVNAPEQLRGNTRVTIIKSPNGYLWAGVNNGSHILVSRSTNNGDSWAEPVAIKPVAIKGEGHWVLINVGGRPNVGFAATEDGAAGSAAKVHFIRLDQDEPSWSNPARWVDETSLLPPWEGDERADDELSAVTFENRAFVVIETEPLGDSRSASRPQLIVFERQSGGGWLKHVILRFTSKGGNDAKRPVITVDAASRQLVVTAGTTLRTHADMYYAPIDALAGRDEQWSRLRVFQVSNATTENIYNNRLPLPRFPVTADADLLLMIDDTGEAQRMWRQVVRSSSSGPGDPVPNRPPVFNQTLQDRSDAEGDAVSFSAAATDPDGDQLTYSASNLPPGVGINSASGLVSGTIAAGSAGTYASEVRVSDGTDTTTGSFTWTVTTAQPPATPSELLATSTTTEVLLDWADNTEGNLAGYHVYRAATATGSYTRLTNTPTTISAYSDATAPPGSSFYRVTAVNAAGQESQPAQTSVAERIVLGSVAQATARDATSLAVPRPAGTSAGDVLLAAVTVSGPGSVSASGWTPVRETTNGSDLRQVVYSRVATASEPASYTFTLSARSSAAGVILRYRGVDVTSPIDASSGQASPSGTSITAPAVQTSGANRVLIGLFGVASSASNGIEPPATMIERADVIQSQGKNKLVLEAADAVQPSSGSSGARTATVSKAGPGIGQLVALRPA